MKGLKWIYAVCSYSLLLVLSVVISSLCGMADVSALKYPINYVPLSLAVSKGSQINPSSGYRITYPFNDPFSVGATGLSVSDFSHDFYYNNHVVTLFATDSDQCGYRSIRGLYNPQNSSDSSHYYNFDIPYYASDLEYSVDYNPGQVYCNKDGEILTPFDQATFNGTGNGLIAKSLQPYRYGFNTIYWNDYGNISGGLPVESFFNFSDIFKDGAIPQKFTRLNIPFGRLSDGFEEIHNGSTITLHAGFWFDSADPENDVFNFQSSPNASLVVKGYYNGWNSSSSGSFGSSSCSWVHWSFGLDDDLPPHQLILTCTWTSDRDVVDSSLLGITLEMSGSDSDPIWDYPATSIGVDRWHLVVNNNYTESDVPLTDFVPSGNNLSKAPGAPLSEDEVADSSFNSLTNLFNFNFLNPFAPLFFLFTDNSQCVSIPIIAGLLNSEETTYCPWFSSDVRNIVTPVVGLSSTMLLFGFLVRWLGARSGNLFEDSFESSGSHIRVGNLGKEK